MKPCIGTIALSTLRLVDSESIYHWEPMTRQHVTDVTRMNAPVRLLVCLHVFVNQIHRACLTNIPQKILHGCKKNQPDVRMNWLKLIHLSFRIAAFPDTQLCTQTIMLASRDRPLDTHRCR